MPNHCEHTLSVNDPLSCYSGCSAGWRVIRRVRAKVRAPVISAITNGSPSNQPPPSSTSPALQSKGTVSTHVKSRMEQEGHSGRKKEGGGGEGAADHLHMPVILIYTGYQPPRLEFSLVAGATGLFFPSLAR